MLEKLKAEVCEANLELVRKGLVLETWGNASAVDRHAGAVVIKPSGIAYGRMKPVDMVVVSLRDGKTLEGKWSPSSDTATHLELYHAFPGIGGIVHTHSRDATVWSQACRSLPCFGTTQADYWNGEIPCTRPLKTSEIRNDYEANTGKVIVETFHNKALDPLKVPSVLVAGHAPFVWGRSVAEAVRNAAVLEFCAGLALGSVALNPALKAINSTLLSKHFQRKHGPDATYGQSEN